MTPHRHVSADTWSAWLAGTLDKQGVVEVEEAIRGCSECAAQLRDLARQEDINAEAARRLRRRASAQRWAGVAAGLALAAGLLLFIQSPTPVPPFQIEMTGTAAMRSDPPSQSEATGVADRQTSPPTVVLKPRSKLQLLLSPTEPSGPAAIQVFAVIDGVPTLLHKDSDDGGVGRTMFVLSEGSPIFAPGQYRLLIAMGPPDTKLTLDTPPASPLPADGLTVGAWRLYERTIEVQH
jgi:hypothetical protein